MKLPAVAAVLRISQYDSVAASVAMWLLSYWQMTENKENHKSLE